MKTKKASVKISYLTQDQADKKMGWTAKDAKEYVRLALKEFEKDGDREMFFYCLLRAVKWIGVAKTAKITGLSRVCIYETLDGTNKKPSIDTLSKILAVLGIKITFELENEKSSPQRPGTSAPYAYL